MSATSFLYFSQTINVHNILKNICINFAFFDYENTLINCISSFFGQYFFIILYQNQHNTVRIFLIQRLSNRMHNRSAVSQQADHYLGACCHTGIFRSVD